MKKYILLLALLVIVGYVSVQKILSRTSGSGKPATVVDSIQDLAHKKAPEMVSEFGHNKLDSLSGEKLLSGNSGSTEIPSSWNTYTNKKFGFTFRYPSAWSENGKEADVVNLSGSETEIDINFIDAISKSSLLVAYHLPPGGAAQYNYVADQYRMSEGWFVQGGKRIVIDGDSAFQCSSLVKMDGRRNKLNPPLRLVIVNVQDKQKSGEIEFQFKTPQPAEDEEINKFNILLSGFKF